MRKLVVARKDAVRLRTIRAAQPKERQGEQLVSFGMDIDAQARNASSLGSPDAVVKGRTARHEVTLSLHVEL